MTQKPRKPKPRRPKVGDIVELDGRMQLKVESVKGKLLLCRSLEHGIPMKIERGRVDLITPAEQAEGE
jgi:hypothetical protein